MEEMLKIIGAIATIFALYKIVVDVLLAKSSKHREEYQFSKEYLKDLNDKDVHNFVLEKGFLALTGKIYSVPEIKHLLSYPNPTDVIYNRSSSGKFIEFDGISKQYIWKGIYKISLLRSFVSPFFMMGYIIFASIALFPLLLNNIEILQGFTLAIFSISFGVTAIASLINFQNYKLAKLLIPEKKHT